MASELAKRTGESLTQAVTVALQQRLDRARKPGASMAEELLSIGRQFSARMSPRMKKLDVGKFLYDEKGLPK